MHSNLHFLDLDSLNETVSEKKLTCFQVIKPTKCVWVGRNRNLDNLDMLSHLEFHLLRTLEKISQTDKSEYLSVIVNFNPDARLI